MTYYCYSTNLKEWFDKNGFSYKFSGTHNETGKLFFAYPKGRVLDMLLLEYEKGLNKK